MCGCVYHSGPNYQTQTSFLFRHLIKLSLPEPLINSIITSNKEVTFKSVFVCDSVGWLVCFSSGLYKKY